MSYIKRLEREAVERRTPGVGLYSAAVRIHTQAGRLLEHSLASTPTPTVPQVTTVLGKILYGIAYVGAAMGYSLDEIAGIALEDLENRPQPPRFAPNDFLKSSRL